MPHKGRKAQYCAAKLNDQRGLKQHGQKLRDAAPRIQVARLTDNVHALEVHAAACGKHDACADRTDAESADLNQDGDDRLPDCRKGVADIHGQQPRDADGARRGVERVYIGQRYAWLDADRQHQQRRADQNSCGKADRDEPRR